MPPNTSGLSGLGELFSEEGFTDFRKVLGFKGGMFGKSNFGSCSMLIYIFEEYRFQKQQIFN